MHIAPNWYDIHTRTYWSAWKAIRAVSIKNKRDCGCESRVDPHSLRYAPSRSIKTEKAAHHTARLATRLERQLDCDLGLDEPGLFEALHTCAYRAARPDRSRSIPCAERCRWAGRWKLVRDHLVEKNLGLVYSMVSGFGRQDLDSEELRSEALYVLMRAVEGFDPWRGFRFSTYACNAIIRSMIHVARRTRKNRLRYAVDYDEWQRPVPRTDPVLELHADRLRVALQNNLGDLTAREAAVIGWRFPMDGGSGMTLTEVGETVGLSKERVRQIQKRALAKLQAVIDADPGLQ